MKLISLPKDSLVVSESIHLRRPESTLPVIRKWRSSFSNAEISRMERFNVLRSRSTLTHFIEVKRLEMLLLGLSESEYQAMIDLPGFLNDQLFQNALLAKSVLLSSPSDHFEELTKLKCLIERLQRLQLLLGKVPWSYHLLNTWLGDLDYCITLTAERIRPFKKYSGYCKTPSSFGNKNGVPPDRPEAHFRASASVAVQLPAFATGVPPDLYAFHRYTGNSDNLSCTQAHQYPKQFPS